MSYSESYFTARESWRDWRIEARWLIDHARVKPGSRVIEIGCGGGGLLRMTCARGAFAIGVDTLEVALQLAQKRVWESGRVGEWESISPSSQFVRISEDGTLPFESATFDALIAQHVVEHIDDIDAALREWKRVLKPGGRISLATPNAHYPDPAHFADADHAHIFTTTELRDAFTRAGFNIHACETIFPFLSRVRIPRALSVIAHRFFARAPYFASRGRTILLAATNSK